MPVTPEYRKEVEAHLARICPLRSKAMFGGVGLYSEEILFGIIDDDKTYFKVDEQNIQDYKHEGMGPWEVTAGQINQGYYQVPQKVIDSDMVLADWVVAAVGVAQRKAANKKKKK